MLDLKFIRDNLDSIIENTKNRQAAANPERVVELYDRRNQLLQASETLRHRRNLNAQAMKQRLESEKRQELIEEGKILKQQISDTEKKLEQINEELNAEAARVPNLSHPEAPVGKGEEDNRELKRWGEPRNFSFPVRDHLQLTQELDLVDFETAARVSGPKFYYLKNEAVHLDLALTRYALDILQKEGFLLTITPDIAKEEVVEGIGFNPRGEESNIYSVEGTGACLVGTAEITLGGFYAGQILDAADLPIKMAGISHCFRREAGAAGQYSKGLYRVHQFSKVEMFIFCTPDQSEGMHQYLLELEERIFQGLEIPYRVVDTCTGELGGPAYRKFDLEAWMPGRGEGGDWGEVTSASNCTDYQARRLAIRFKEDGKNQFVHMLNGTAVAISRALISILENHQQSDGSVRIPKILIPYTGFDRIPAR
ncbi:MAG: serine--tRNA ligase [Spirochaetaceae bacterium]|nr:MAG: serine--tRNA ligase [Spirochaetaceae bacterium]